MLYASRDVFGGHLSFELAAPWSVALEMPTAIPGGENYLQILTTH